jgi:hypothetical protein
MMIALQNTDKYYGNATQSDAMATAMRCMKMGQTAHNNSTRARKIPRHAKARHAMHNHTYSEV